MDEWFTGSVAIAWNRQKEHSHSSFSPQSLLGVQVEYHHGFFRLCSNCDRNSSQLCISLSSSFPFQSFEMHSAAITFFPSLSVIGVEPVSVGFGPPLSICYTQPTNFWSNCCTMTGRSYCAINKIWFFYLDLSVCSSDSIHQASTASHRKSTGCIKFISVDLLSSETHLGSDTVFVIAVHCCRRYPPIYVLYH